MLISEFSELFEFSRRHGIRDDITEELISDFESEYGYAPRSFSDLLEVLE